MQKEPIGEVNVIMSNPIFYLMLLMAQKCYNHYGFWKQRGIYETYWK